MTTYYKILAVVIESASPPEGGGPFLTSTVDKNRALNAISLLPGDMLTASGGMGGLTVDTLVWTANVESTDYDIYSGNGLSYISPTKLRVTINPDSSYDFIAIYTSAAQNPTSTGTPAINGGAFNNAGYWANCSIDRSLLIGLHEFGHLVETWLKYTHDYYNFPVCTVASDADTNSVHCAFYYGFPNTFSPDPDGSISPAYAQVSPAWYAAFFTGTVGDGAGPLLDNRGINATGWAFPTKHSTSQPIVAAPGKPVVVVNGAGHTVSLRYRYV